MDELLKAIKNLPKREKVHTVKIAGQDVVVSLAKKLEVMKHGEDAYMWKTPTEFVLKPPKKAKASYTVLQEAAKGYEFEQGDIHWPTGVVEKGVTWIKSE